MKIESVKYVSDRVVDVVVDGMDVKNVSLDAIATIPEAVRAWIAAGNTPEPNPDAEPRLVPKRWIIDRLHEAGKLEQALAVLNAADVYTQQRWASRDSIYFNDPTLVAALVSIGADPAVILAE